MVTFPLTAPTGRMFRFPTRTEVRAMLDRPAVFVTTVLAGLIAFLAVLTAVVYLVITGHDTSAVTGLLGGSLLGLVINLRSKMGDLHNEVQQVKQATTGGTDS